MNETAFDTSYLVKMGVVPHHYTSHFRDEWTKEHGASYHLHLGLAYHDGSSMVHCVQIVGESGSIASITLRNGAYDRSLGGFCTPSLGAHPHFWRHFETLAREFCKDK